MQFTTTAKVTGMKKFKDAVEGKSYDSTKLFIETNLDDSSGNAKGFASSEYPFSDSSEFDKLSHLPFPITAEITIELVTTGKVQKQRVIAIKPLAHSKPAVEHKVNENSPAVADSRALNMPSNKA
ncbi:MAG: hypothetical protein WC091_02135 [Sulfuricellaceae bacterium]